MRKVNLALLFVLTVGLGLPCATSRAQSEPGTLADLLRRCNTVAFQLSGAGECHIWILSQELERRSQEYYANKTANALQVKLLRAKARNPEVRANADAQKAIEAKIRLLVRPTGNYRVGRVTTKGRDFIGITELGQTTEYLIPFRKLSRVKRDVDLSPVVGGFVQLETLAGPGADRIVDALMDDTSLEYDQVPLGAVIDDIKFRHNLLILLDGRALENAGLATDTTLSKFLDGVSLNDGLGELLEPLGLTGHFRYEVLWVTTPGSGLVMGRDRVRVDPNSPLGRQLDRPLRREVGLEYFDSPLRDVLIDMSNRFQLKLINHADPNRPVTVSVEGVSLRAALGILLHDLDLYCDADGDALVVK